MHKSLDKRPRTAATGSVPVCRPTAEDLEAQAAAVCEQEQADRDYRDLARLVVGVAPCRRGTLDCLPCRVRKWLALGR
jgi:hypothetical protein